MKLDLELVKIEDIEFGSKTSISKDVLIVDREELKSLLETDTNFAEVNIDLAKPGESTRIINVVDVVEPRVKISGGVDFPGALEKFGSAGRGTTRALKGISVVFCDSHPHWLHSKSLIDMDGVGAELGRYGKMPNIVIGPVPKGNIAEFEYARSVKVAGLRAATYLARAAKKEQIFDTETYELDPKKKRINDLPKIAYFYQVYSPQHDPRGIPDPIFYGHPISTTLPLVVHPNEIIDGGILSGYTIRMMETYSIQNHPIIMELYRRHEKNLNFVGVVFGVSSMESARRPLAAMMVGNIISDTLGANGVIMTKALGGAPTVDLGEAAVECERLGVKTCLLLQILNTETFLNSEAMFSSRDLNALINTGVIFGKARLPVLHKVIGGFPDTPVFNDTKKQVAGEAIEVEQRFICGCLSQIGASRMKAVQY